MRRTARRAESKEFGSRRRFSNGLTVWYRASRFEDHLTSTKPPSRFCRTKESAHENVSGRCNSVLRLYHRPGTANPAETGTGGLRCVRNVDGNLYLRVVFATGSGDG